jgi:uncharacterized membrane protein
MTEQYSYEPQEPKKRSHAMWINVAIAAAVVLGILLMVGVVPRIMRQGELKKMHEETVGAVPIVRTITAKSAYSAAISPGSA